MVDLLTNKPDDTKYELRTDLRGQLLAQKTELIAELTRAMANQFNNTMMSITSYAELEMKKAPPTQRRSLEQVLSNAARATNLVHKLLTLSRRQAMSLQPLDLNNSLNGIRDFIEQLIRENASLVYSLDPAIEMINADPAEVEQVVLCLAINARNAMSKGGTLTATTKLIELTKESPGLGELERLGKYVMLSIDDTGSAQSADELGMESSSTPDQDSRVNLSFAAVRGIVQNSQGMVRFSSEPGKGSSFKIYFPAISQLAARGRDRTSPRSVPVARTILVVEDDDSVLVPATEFLKMEGFKVLQARTGAEAIHVVQQNRSLPDVLITDIIMPKMSGREVAEKLRELHPGLKVLFMSGDDSVANLPPNGKVQNTVLRKPFRLDTLKDKIHELLGE
jgi:two-component system, cell cycle sensor histidine kinase and response regulator CckA